MLSIVAATLYNLPDHKFRVRLDLYQFDEEYVRRLRAGDPVIESHFVSYFSQLLQLKLRSRLPSSQHVNDARQETFARVLTAIRSENSLRQADRLGAFVNSVCNNVLLESYRARARYEPLESLPAEPTDNSINLDGMLITQETRNKVHKVLSQLPEKDRELLRRVLLEEKNKDEVCQDLGVSRDYLRVLLHRAKQQFLAQYQKM